MAFFLLKGARPYLPYLLFSDLRDELCLDELCFDEESFEELSLEELSFDDPSFVDPSFDDASFEDDPSDLSPPSFLESFESLPPSEEGA